MHSHTTESTDAPLLGCIADDYTGATDLATNLVQGGMRVVQFFGIPEINTFSAIRETDAIVIALKTRSVAADNAVSQSIAALQALKKFGASRFYFKYCSTFDSTPAGNIGPVAEALMHELGVPQTIFCPAFPRAGRTVYRGHLFVGDQLLNESGMENHPLTPMHDANLVRVLSQQSTRQVGLLSYENFADDFQNTFEQLQSLEQHDVSLVVTDACDESHLARLAEAAVALPLVTGGSGLARHLPHAYREHRMLNSNDSAPPQPTVRGQSLIIAGSCSKATNAQVKWMQERCPFWPVNVINIFENATAELDRLLTWAKKSDSDQPLLVASTTSPPIVSNLQKRFGKEVLATRIENFLSQVAKALVSELGIRRLVIAGGETSGAIINALGIRSIRIGSEICPGVPWTETMSDQSHFALALKSGNFGSEDFFQTALEMLP